LEGAVAHGTEFSIDFADKRHPARYHMVGKVVVVTSIYGDSRGPLGKDMPLMVASRLLTELVQKRMDEKAALAERQA